MTPLFGTLSVNPDDRASWARKTSPLSTTPFAFESTQTNQPGPHSLPTTPDAVDETMLTGTPRLAASLRAKASEEITSVWIAKSRLLFSIGANDGIATVNKMARMATTAKSSISVKARVAVSALARSPNGPHVPYAKAQPARRVAGPAPSCMILRDQMAQTESRTNTRISALSRNAVVRPCASIAQ